MARALIAVILAALALGACGGDGGGGGSEGVSMQLFGDPEELVAYRDLARAYEDKTGKRVSLVEVPDRDAHLQKLSTSFASGKPPNIFLINYRNYGAYVDSEKIDPAGPRLEKSKALKREDFYPGPLKAFSRDGVLQCMPQNASSLVVYYNRDLLRGAGLKDPPRGWTYEDMVAMARKLDSNEEYDALGVDPNMIRASPFVWSAGGEVVDDYEAPTRFTLDTPEARRGLEALLALDEFGPAELPARGKPLDERFLDGTLAMIMSSRREVPTFRTAKGFEWDVAPFPRIANDAGVLHSDGFCISKGDKADEAWEFVEFAFSREGSRLLSESGRTVPSLRKVAESDAFLDASKPPKSNQVFLDAIPNVRAMPSSASWNQLEEGADIAVEEAFYKELGVEGVLTRLEKETDGKF